MGIFEHDFVAYRALTQRMTTRTVTLDPFANPNCELCNPRCFRRNHQPSNHVFVAMSAENPARFDLASPDLSRRRGLFLAALLENPING